MKKSARILPLVLAAAAPLVMASGASAHTGHETGFSLVDGALHPLGGLDHLAAMISVGIWAALAGGRRVWIWPLAFVLMMLVGGFLGHAGVGFPAVEPAIALSVIVLGIAVALGVKAPLAVGAVLIGVFALFHGHAHGAEAPAEGWYGYATGFALSTALLHCVGIAIGFAIARLSSPVAARVIGAATAALGVFLMVG
ncbi:MAG TPA: HupE/UreJ family protein [Hyphomicrobiaceae bacterium]|jgi:urease accessory protein|nr:HupE/UreJ family protein [Hyphomicrobiaceae bacterium]